MTVSFPDFGLYIHIPFCHRKCPYCAFYSVPILGRQPDRLVDALLKEIDMAELPESPLTIYIGGGSPTCLPDETLLRLISSLTQRFGHVEEFTVECNPAQVSELLFKQLSAAGVNRISIGAQSFDAKELQLLGRMHSPEQIEQAVYATRDVGFENIGLDLIFGLPGSDLMRWQSTLDNALELGIQHISAYSLTVEHHTPFERAVRQGTLTMLDEATERAMYELTRTQLVSAGYEHYEISNFAKPGFACRHNLRYWKNWSVVGIGPAAAGWYRGCRTMNRRDVDAYVEMIETGRFAYLDVQTPTPEEIASETAILNLRLREGINRDEYISQTGFDVFGLFDVAIEKNYTLGFIEYTDTRIYLTDPGLSVADTVAQDFIL